VIPAEPLERPVPAKAGPLIVPYLITFVEGTKKRSALFIAYSGNGPAGDLPGFFFGDVGPEDI